MSMTKDQIFEEVKRAIFEYSANDVGEIKLESRFEEDLNLDDDDLTHLLADLEIDLDFLDLNYESVEKKTVGEMCDVIYQLKLKG